jgi:D-alanyl-lipoteichoic acid acyltransferase DltB (MBOAT superfamily)
MSLTSLYYLFFLACVALLYYAVKHEWRIYLLLFASFIFYYVNQHWYLVFLLASILINYGLCALWLRTRFRYLIYLAVGYNILVLAFFKYIPVILFGSSIPDDSIWTRLILPIGISFFSFQAIGYVLDLYWMGAARQATFGQFSLYMSFFPQLLSGPIARGKSFLPQITKRKEFNYDNVVSGARLILWGLFKKLVIANNLSPYTDAVFNNLNMHKGFTLVLAIIAYTIQVYMDFSGYSDIAIGSAKTLGFDLMDNFRTPFFAKSVTEFWRRWHISLSSWVRDYVNLPLQYKFRKFGLWGIFGAVFVTFFIIGIWHGAYWNYVLFGFIQGCAISYEAVTQQFRQRLWSRLPNFISSIVSNVIVFVFFALSAILLRASVSDAALILSKLSFNPRGMFLGSKQLLIYSGIGVSIVWVVEYLLRDQPFVDYFRKLHVILRWVCYVGVTILILLIGSLNSENFIYFQF